MAITLKCKTRSPEVFNLEHAFACVNKCGCSELEQLVIALNPKTGDKGKRLVTKQICASLMVFPGVPVEVPDEYATVPGIKAAIADKRLIATPVVEAAVTPAKATKSTSEKTS